MKKILFYLILVISLYAENIVKADGCYFTKINIDGEEVILIENEIMTAKILLTGGNVIEYQLKKNPRDIIYFSKEAISNKEKLPEYGYVDLFIPYGFPGPPIWNKRLNFKVIKSSQKELSILFYGSCDGIRLEKKITIYSNKPILDTHIKYILEEGERNLAIRTHGVFKIGCAADNADTYFIPTLEGLKAIPYSQEKIYTDNSFYPSENWWVLIDKREEIGVIKIFSLEDIEKLYCFYNTNSYNMEEMGKVKSCKKGDYVEAKIRWRLLDGLSDIGSFKKGVILSVQPYRKIYGRNEKSEFLISIHSLTEIEVEEKFFISFKIKSSDGKGIYKEERWVELFPWRTTKVSISWDTHDSPDGKYSIECILMDKNKKEIIRVHNIFEIDEKIVSLCNSLFHNTEKILEEVQNLIERKGGDVVKLKLYRVFLEWALEDAKKYFNDSDFKKCIEILQNAKEKISSVIVKKKEGGDNEN